MKSPSLEVFKRCVDRALRDTFSDRTWWVRKVVGLEDLDGLFQLVLFNDFVNEMKTVKMGFL